MKQYLRELGQLAIWPAMKPVHAAAWQVRVMFYRETNARQLTIIARVPEPIPRRQAYWEWTRTRCLRLATIMTRCLRETLKYSRGYQRRFEARLTTVWHSPLQYPPASSTSEIEVVTPMDWLVHISYSMAAPVIAKVVDHRARGNELLHARAFGRNEDER